jgi:hypothetical protein
MTKDEVLKLSLEALEYIDLCDNDRDFLHPHECFQLDEAITAIKQALAAPVQEPVMEYPDYTPGVGWRNVTPPAAQRQWVGLTTEDMATCIDQPAWDLVLRKAEQILKEKNT